MIIHKLEMYNFRQYIGEQSVSFSTDPQKNVTVLIGVNTSGKTTIIRAFEWCLYGKNGFEDPVLLNNEVRDNMYVEDVQETWVAVTFSHDDKRYTIKRKYKYVCNERKTENGKTIVNLNKKPEEEISLEYLQQDGQTKTPIEKSGIAESMDRVLPKDLSDYFFFGGERISDIANRTDLSKAVRGLMRLDVLENAREHLTKVNKTFNGMIDTSGDASAEKAKAGLETYRKQKATYQEELENTEQQAEYWKQKELEYNTELAKSNVEEVKKAQEKRKRIESTLQKEQKKLADAKTAMVTLFNKRPYAFFGMPAIKKSLELLDTVKESTECVPEMEQKAIDYLINRGFCICGTKLDIGTLPHTKVMEERRKLPPEHIGSVVMNYKSKSEGYLSGSESFFSDIANKFKEIRVIQRDIGQLKDELTEQAEIIIDDSTAKQLENKRREAAMHLRDAQAEYSQLQKQIGMCEQNIQNCENVISKFANSSKKNAKVAQFIAYSEKVLEWLVETYRSKEIVVRNELQKRVNSNFAKMYHGERSIVIDDKYRVRYSDITTEESDGLKAVKSFAFIASLVSMAKDKILDDNDMKLGQVYPLVMDAPFSNVDEIHIDNICQILPKTANQVIMAVMKKDWEYAATNLEAYVGMSYNILKDTDADGKEIDTSTHIMQ